MENDEVFKKVNTDFYQSEHHEDDEDIHSDWESEDEVPLSVLQIKQRGVHVIWTRNSSNVVDVNPFLEDSLPKIPEDIETPTAIF